MTRCARSLTSAGGCAVAAICTTPKAASAIRLNILSANPLTTKSSPGGAAAPMDPGPGATRRELGADGYDGSFTVDNRSLRIDEHVAQQASTRTGPRPRGPLQRRERTPLRASAGRTSVSRIHSRHIADPISVGGQPMRYLVVNDDATPDELREAITHLRAKQRHACIPSTRDELDADINELLDLLSGGQVTA